MFRQGEKIWFSSVRDRAVDCACPRGDCSRRRKCRPMSLAALRAAEAGLPLFVLLPPDDERRRAARDPRRPGALNMHGSLLPKLSRSGSGELGARATERSETGRHVCTTWTRSRTTATSSGSAWFRSRGTDTAKTLTEQDGGRRRQRLAARELRTEASMPARSGAHSAGSRKAATYFGGRRPRGWSMIDWSRSAESAPKPGAGRDRPVAWGLLFTSEGAEAVGLGGRHAACRSRALGLVRVVHRPGRALLW